jgi:hypothetical protein
MISSSFADQIDDYLLIFDGACIRNMHDVQVIPKIAENLRWKKIPKEFAAGSAPREGELVGNWMVQERGLVVFIAVAQANISNRNISTCSAVTKLHDNNKVIDRIQTIYKAKIISDETEGYQRYRVFKFDYSGDEMLIIALRGCLKKA